MKLSYEMNECIKKTCEDGSHKTRFYSRDPKLPSNDTNVFPFSSNGLQKKTKEIAPRDEKPHRCECQNDQSKMRRMSRCLESILVYISLVIQLRLRS
jgi:hypothetical protein